MRRALSLLLLVITVACAVAAVRIVWKRNERAAGLDFYVYWVTGQIARRPDVANIYSRDTQERIGEEYYARALDSGQEIRIYDANRRRSIDNPASPFILTLFTPMSHDYERALRLYHAFAIAAFLASVLLIARVVKLPWSVALGLLALLLLWYRPFEADLRMGNVNALHLLLVSLYLTIAAAAKRPAAWIAGGFLIAIALCIKPNMLFVAPLILIARFVRADWRRCAWELLGGMAGMFTGFAAAALNYGSARVWTDWFSAAQQLFERLPDRNSRNITAALPWFQKYGTWPSAAIAILLFSIASLAIFAGRKRPRDDGRYEALVVGTALVLYFLSSTLVWLHYMILVLPLALALMRRPWSAVASIVALVLLAEVPYELLFHTGLYPRDPIVTTPALLILFTCGVIALARSDLRPAALV